ncbi:MAG: hypothetical protein Q8S01_01555, partial [Ignavibacteria bacterium]|nr:hypothetical protein [Ignavibacteria bacterium]
LFAALPFDISGMKFAAGVGFVEYANADYYYENRTAFSRDLDYITLPIAARPHDSVAADWRRDVRERDGSIYGYGGALSATIAENFSVGISGIYFSGTMKDMQTSERYGQLQIFYKDFRYVAKDSLSIVVANGTSDVHGLELTFSAVYRTKNLLFGASFKLPTKINRDFTVTSDSTYGAMTVALPEDKGSDNITLPWCGSVGIGINLRTNVFLSCEYEYKPYRLAEYTDKDGIVTKPWLDCSNFHFGMEYLPVDIVAVRFGFQTKSEVFEQQANAFRGDPVSYTVYSAGVGVRVLPNIQINLGYEYFNMHYEDNWFLNTNVNKDIRSTLFGSISYTLK